jgi:hypothetical protein
MQIDPAILEQRLNVIRGPGLLSDANTQNSEEQPACGSHSGSGGQAPQDSQSDTAHHEKTGRSKSPN